MRWSSYKVQPAQGSPVSIPNRSEVDPKSLTFLRPFPSISVHSIAMAVVRMYHWPLSVGRCIEADPSDSSEQSLALQRPLKLSNRTYVTNNHLSYRSAFGHSTCSVMPCLKEEVSSSGSWRLVQIFSKAPGFSWPLYFCVSLDICLPGMRLSICIFTGGSRDLSPLQAIISTRATMREIKLVVQRSVTEA